MKELSYLKILFKYRLRFLSGIFFVVISNVFALYPAQYVRQAFDSVKEVLDASNSLENNTSELTEPLLYFGLLIISFALLKGVFMFFMRQTIIVMSRLIEFDLKMKSIITTKNLISHFIKGTILVI